MAPFPAAKPLDALAAGGPEGAVTAGLEAGYHLSQVGGAAVLADDRCADVEYEMQVIGHDDVFVYRYHLVMGGDGCEQFVLHLCSCLCQTDGGAIGIRTYHLAEGLPHTLCHMYGDVVDAGA